ncbi:MAG: flagellar filament capping protein FliD [Sphingomonas sp.]
MVDSIVSSLGAGSGIDIPSLVTQLVDAQFAARKATLTKRSDALTTQISAAAGLKTAIAGFDTALKSLIKTGSLATQPTSSNASIVKVSALAGASVAGLSATVEVRQLAAAQSAGAAPVPSASAAVGTGTLTIAFGTATVADGAMNAFAAGPGTPVNIAITSANSSLTGIRDAINAADAGVTAAILTDSGGARLVLKSATGASQAFTMTATEDVGAPGLAALSIGVGAAGTTIGSAARDAIVAVDGVALRRSSNAVLDLIPGVRLDLVSAAPGANVALGTQPPVDALAQAVNDVVETYNELYAQLKAAVDPVTGPLKGDPAARSLLVSLRGLTLKPLTGGDPDAEPTTLSGIGVATNRDGTLRVDDGALAASLITYPDAVEAMFRSGTGLSAALSTIATAATNVTYGLGASEARYAKAKSTLTTDQEKAVAAAEALRTRMTRQFASMDAIVASYKSTQTFLENQVDAWNSDN